jgi:hypothetical protein
MAVLVVAAQPHLMEQFMPVEVEVAAQPLAVLVVLVVAAVELILEQELLAMYIPVVVAVEQDKVHLVEEREAQV